MVKLIKFELKKILRKKIVMAALIGALIANILFFVGNLYNNRMQTDTNKWINGFDTIKKVKEYDTSISGFTDSKWRETIKMQYESVKSNPENVEIDVLETESQKQKLIKDGFSEDEIKKALPVIKVKPEVYYEKLQKYDGTKDILWIYDINYPNTIKYFKDMANAAVEQGKNATIYKKTAEIYEKLLKDKDKFHYDYQLGWRKLIHTVRNMGTYIGGIIIIIALAGMFADERSTKFDSILLTTKYGRNKLIVSKLIVGMIITALYWLAINIITIASHSIVYSLDGFKSAVQLDISYMNVAYEISIGKFFIIVIFLNLLGGLLLSTLTMFISTKFKSAFITLILSGVVFFIPVIRTNVEFINDIFLFTPLKIMDGTAQMYSQCYNIFGRAITQLPTIIIFAVTVTIALIILTYYSFKKVEVVS